MEDVGRQSNETFRVDVEVATGERLFSSLMDMICGSAGTVMGWFGVAPRIYFDNNLLVDYGKVPKDYGVYVSGLRRIYELTFETIHRDLEDSLA